MLKDLIRKSLVWSSKDLIFPLDSRRTGYRLLDEILPGGGWPKNGLTEIVSDGVGMGGLRLLLPAIAEATNMRGKVVCVDPPHKLYPSSLLVEGLNLSNFLIIKPSETLSSRDYKVLSIYEDALKCEGCLIALFWAKNISFGNFRRLQLAAVSGDTWGIVFRSAEAAYQPSPSPLRISLQLSSLDLDIQHLEVKILKTRGGIQGQSFSLSL